MMNIHKDDIAPCRGPNFYKSLIKIFVGPFGAVSKGRLVKILGCFLLLVFLTLPTFGEITGQNPIDVKILYDLSGSMYPGYPETPRHVSGVSYFHQYPEFRNFLTNFVRKQNSFKAKNISIYTFRSLKEFDTNDIKAIQPPLNVSTSADNIDSLFSHLQRKRGVDFTHLRESLDYVTTNNFEGLVWVITDNRVESVGDNQTTKDFFLSLKRQEKYRSVHIYKFPFDDTEKNQHADLAVYGILVSPSPIEDSCAADFDNRFDSFKTLFPGKRHLKLKDLSVAPISLDIQSNLGVDLETKEKLVKTEGSLKGIPFSVSIAGKLTQHTITGGKIKIRLQGELKPKDAALAKKYGLKPIPATHFQPAILTLTGDIPPGTSQNLGRFHLYAARPISIPVTGMSNQLEAALNPFKVEFTGRGIVASDRLVLELKREGIEAIREIYSSGDISAIFLPEDEKLTIQANPVEFDVAFTLKSGSSRGLVLLILLVVVLVLAAIVIFIMARKESYPLRIKGKDTPLLLRRLGSYDITVDKQYIGTVRRGMGGSLGFAPNMGVRDMLIKPTKTDGEFLVTLPDATPFYIFIPRLRSHGTMENQDPTGPPPPPGAGTGTAPGAPRVKIRPPKR
ncbi:MAG: hypothetical protein GY765_09095 [bacterium]|nr:hypothetical protein [bacterium]